MRTPEEILEDNVFDFNLFKLDNEYSAFNLIKSMKEYAKQQSNQAVIDCSESATAYITQESVNGGKVAKVNSESILKNLKK